MKDKSVCYDLFSKETENYKKKCRLVFGWKLYDAIGTIKSIEQKYLQVTLNLRMIRQRFIPEITNAQFHMSAWICYLAAYGFENEGYLFAPSVLDKRKTHKCFKLTAKEIAFAVWAVQRARDLCEDTLSEEEKEKIKEQLDEWELFLQLPEIAYYGSTFPQFADINRKEYSEQYQKLSVEHIKRVQGMKSKLLNDNLMAIEKIARGKSYTLGQYGIHPLGF